MQSEQMYLVRLTNMSKLAHLKTLEGNKCVRYAVPTYSTVESKSDKAKPRLPIDSATSKTYRKFQERAEKLLQSAWCSNT